jgi:hypothetical protein
MILIRLQYSKRFCLPSSVPDTEHIEGSPCEPIPRAPVCTVDALMTTVHLPFQRASASAPAHALNASIGAPRALPSSILELPKKRCNRKTKRDASGYGHEPPSNVLMYRAACPQTPLDAELVCRTVFDECVYVRVFVNSSGRICMDKKRGAGGCRRMCILTLKRRASESQCRPKCVPGCD